MILHNFHYKLKTFGVNRWAIPSAIPLKVTALMKKMIRTMYGNTAVTWNRILYNNLLYFVYNRITICMYVNTYINNFWTFCDSFHHCQVHQHPTENQASSWNIYLLIMFCNANKVPPIIQLISSGLSTSGEMFNVSLYQK